MDFGTAELVPDTDRPGAWTLLLNGLPQSHVDTEHPTRLEFGYMRRLAYVIDAVAPRGEPLSVLHLGGGAMTMPRYVAATRPGSSQLVIEHDAALAGLIRRVLPLPRKERIRVRIADAHAAVGAGRAGRRFQVVLVDVPDCRFTMDFVAGVRRVLTLGGCVGMNIVDGHARAHAVTMRAVAAQVCLMAEGLVLRGRRSGNVVLAASDRLPVRALSDATARDAVPLKFMSGSELDRFIVGAKELNL